MRAASLPAATLIFDASVLPLFASAQPMITVAPASTSVAAVVKPRPESHPVTAYTPGSPESSVRVESFLRAVPWASKLLALERRQSIIVVASAAVATADKTATLRWSRGIRP